MPENQKAHLIKMANQIAANMAWAGNGAADKVADHIRRFWPAAMRREAIECLAGEGELSPIAAKALEKLDNH